MIGAAAAIAAAVGPLLGGFVTTYLSWRVGFALEVVIIAVVLSQIRLVKDVEYTGSREIDKVGAGLSVVGMGGVVLGILVWQEGGEFVLLIMAVGAVALASLARWLVRRKRENRVTLLDPDLFRLPHFTTGISGQMLQQVTLGGAMIALPLFLQMTLEYNAMQAGLSLAPLSLTMFAAALLAGRRAGGRRPAAVIRAGFLLAAVGVGDHHPDGSPGGQRVVARRPAGHRRWRPGPAGLPAEQLHPGAHRGGASQRGRRGQLRCRVLRALVRARDGRWADARRALVQLHQPDREQHRDPPGAAATDRSHAGGRRRGDEQQCARGADRRATPGGRGGRSWRSTTRPATVHSRSRCSSRSSPPSSGSRTPSGCCDCPTSNRPPPSRAPTSAEPSRRRAVARRGARAPGLRARSRPSALGGDGCVGRHGGRHHRPTASNHLADLDRERQQRRQRQRTPATGSR